MTRYRYEAARPDGGMTGGIVDAVHERAALDELIRRRLFPVRVEPAAPGARRRIPAKHLAVLFKSLATLTRAGVPLDRALALTAGRSRLGPLVAEVARRVREGLSLSDALRAAGEVPGVTIGLVRAGESAGLDFALDEAARQLERDAELSTRLRGALAYPLVLLVAGTATIAVLVTTVLPRFVALLGDLGDALPASTRTLLGLSALVSAHWVELGVGALAVAALGVRWIRTAAGHEVLLGIPVVGPIRRGLATARAARTLSALLGVGAPALSALHHAVGAAGDRAVGRRLGRAAARVREGEAIAPALAAENALDVLAVDLVAIGEESGKISAMLSHAADLVEAEATRSLHAAVRILEPVLILLLGGAVAFVALALLQAVYGVRLA